MTARKHDGSHRNGRGDQNGETHDSDGNGRESRPDREHRDFPVFIKLRGARWLGSAPPTAEAYARALSIWRRLPGAIGTSATDLTSPEQPVGGSPDKKDTS